jgi:hypothetical protein
MTTELATLLERSSAEAVASIAALDPAEAARHQEECARLTARAMAALIERRVAFPFQRAA